MQIFRFSRAGRIPFCKVKSEGQLQAIGQRYSRSENDTRQELAFGRI